MRDVELGISLIFRSVFIRRKKSADLSKSPKASFPTNLNPRYSQGTPVSARLWGLKNDRSKTLHEEWRSAVSAPAFGLRQSSAALRVTPSTQLALLLPCHTRKQAGSGTDNDISQSSFQLQAINGVHDIKMGFGNFSLFFAWWV